MKAKKTGQENPQKTDGQGGFPFFNRELSWLEFNKRVLGEARDRNARLLERLKFLSIVSSNLDEFFQIRVASLCRQIASGNYVSDPSGMSPASQLEEVYREARKLVSRQYRCLHEEILPQLAGRGLVFLLPKDYTEERKSFLSELFTREIFPVLTPFRMKKGENILSPGNLKLHAAFLLEALAGAKTPFRDEEDSPLVAAVHIPSILPRVIFLPKSPADTGKVYFTLLEYAILENAFRLFEGYKIKESILFRVTRDGDIGVDEERDEDFVDAMEEVLVRRENSAVVRLSVTDTGGSLRDILSSFLEIRPPAVFEYPDPIDISGLDPAAFPGFDNLRDESWIPRGPHEIPGTQPVWEVLKHRDILLHHPYDSFQMVVRLLGEAACDPEVLALKITLYRTSGDSPIIQALERAAQNGKQVTAVMELKARFDEERNIEWAQRLQRAGAIVIYGIAYLKVHAKALLIVRKEKTAVCRYVHLSTGNYNDKTARLYTDIGFLTSREDIARDVSLFFNAVTGCSVIPSLKKLLMSPENMKRRLVSLIEREAARGTEENPGLIMAKMNSLADPQIITALYQASQKGVKIRLIVRGICMLVPGIKNVSENISVISIVDRFLEHSRVFYFSGGGSEEVYCSSADWMPRNLERRVELMFPVEQRDLKKRLIHILKTCLLDNVQAHELKSDGSYERRKCDNPKKAVRSQRVFYEEALEDAREAEKTSKKEFTVRRKPPREIIK
ncbi:MAG: polyphosphate kinase 1 [Spirochaetales bacterium]|jgi:polyphosphate kinase|nr:polyphosphate kinase 1 [Spirochaetales bacterium]